MSVPHPRRPHLRRLCSVAVTTVLAAGLLSGLAVAPTTAAPTAPTRAAAKAPTPAAEMGVPSEGTAGGLTVENSFVSDQGWVKPGDDYVSRILLTNTTDAPVAGATVTVTAPLGSTFTDARGPGTHPVTDDEVVWIPGDVAGGATSTLILESSAATTDQEPTIVWRDISTTAELDVATADATVTSHGPRVIPRGETYETAKYGDRPFPVVPVSYTDREYQSSHDRDLDTVINSPDFEGSTFNLFQEMSLGQLYPDGSVPSDGLATADFDYAPGFDFIPRAIPGDSCTGGATFADTPAEEEGTPLYPERISNGVYQLPGNTEFYGADSGGTAIAGPGQIDSGCGAPGKLVRDAAAIADPEIDYSDFDTDKDGVVDFFMAVFAGCGGNGASQLTVIGCPYTDRPYDNIWPHSSSLEFYFTDEATGLPGFTTDDQLKDVEGRPLWYTDDTYSEKTTTDMGDDLKVFVRVGPYNVNPETAIDTASVISHEYGHSLGLPDFYSSSGGRETYGDWNLMATDKSQNMDIFSRQELGWVVPEVLEPGSSRSVDSWKDSKQDIDSITWATQDGTPYTLEDGPDGRVQNSQAYVAKLPGRQLIDPSVFDTGDKASKTHAWWSQSGNDFGCAPEAGHNLDLLIPELADVDPASTVQLEFKSLWDIEWDYDYGFVMTTTDNGESYSSHESENGYTTENAEPTEGNPFSNACQAEYDHGITGGSGSYEAGPQQVTVDRKLAASGEGGYDLKPVFLADNYDISDLAGEKLGALRFSYATDPGLARPGWFIDDVKVTVTEPGKQPREVLVTDFEDSGSPDDERVYNGGCREDLQTATKCTTGWSYVAAGAEAPADHAYYLEMRDRSGFDLDGQGQIDRSPIEFHPGLSLVYTDETHGYGNNGVPDPPAQSPLDSQPMAGEPAPDLNDAAFVAKVGRSRFSDKGAGHTDNYEDPGSEDGNWHFRYDCLEFAVTSMTGDTNGPETSDGDLTGDVDFTMGGGCGEFDYGYGDGGEPPAENTAPSAAATATPDGADTGEEITLKANGSDDAETPDDLDYSWDFDNGGSNKDAAGVEVKHAYDNPGTYDVTVTVTDPSGASDTATVPVTVAQNENPRAKMRVRPKNAYTSSTMRLSGKGSTDSETSTNDLLYEWNFGDGAPKVDAVGKNVRAKFRKPGFRTVGLTVTDEDGNSDVASTRLLVRKRVACQTRRVERSGSWRTVRSDRAIGGQYCDNLGRGQGEDTMTMQFRGPRINIVHGESSRGGKAKVIIDGQRRANLSFENGRSGLETKYRKLYRGLGAGEHTIQIVVLRGAAYLEGFIIRR